MQSRVYKALQKQGEHAGQMHSQVSQVVQSLEWVMEYDFFTAIKSLGFSQEWEHYKPVSWTNVKWGVVIMFHPEFQLNTILVLCLPDHTAVPQTAEQQASFVLELHSCSDTTLPVLVKLWEAPSKALWAKVLWFISEKSPGNSTTVTSNWQIKSMYSLPFSRPCI